MTLLSGINHAALMTRNLDRTIDFYRAVFGAEVVFADAAPGLRHAILRVGQAMLHPVELPDNPHADGGADMFRRGHVDHLGLDVASAEAFEEVRRRLVARGASDGQVTDLGPQLSFWFQDPDGMRAEVCWVRDRSLGGFHDPVDV